MAGRIKDATLAHGLPCAQALPLRPMISPKKVHGSCRPAAQRTSWSRRIPTSAETGAGVFSLAPPSKHLDAAPQPPNLAATLNRSPNYKKSMREEDANAQHSSICNAAAPIYWHGQRNHCFVGGSEYTMIARWPLSATVFLPLAYGARGGGRAGRCPNRAGHRPPRSTAFIGRQGNASAFGQSGIRADGLGGRGGWLANTFETSAGPQRILCTRRRRLTSLKVGA
jgi:hypothetical protein